MVVPLSPAKSLQAELAKLRQKLEHTEALRAAELDALAGLVRVLERIGGYVTTEDRLALQHARALLAEAGR